MEYDVYGFTKLLVFGGLLNPASKSSAIRQNSDYFEAILKENFNPDNVYDTLDFIAANKDRIIRRINANLVKKAGRSPEIIYYDVTNFYFEIDEPDEDILDDDGTVFEKGQRKMGVCKEERKLPIVQMGLFMDDNGIPIAIESFPGNTMDHLTLRPALKKNIDNLDFSLEVIDKCHGLTQIEDQFRVMKGDLDTRPLYVRTPEHVNAHLLTCMIALILLRIIQKRIVGSGLVHVEESAYWNTGLNSERIQIALNKWKVDLLPGELYRFMDVDDPDLKLILDAFDIKIPAKLYRRSELKTIKTHTKIFI